MAAKSKNSGSGSRTNPGAAAGQTAGPVHLIFGEEEYKVAEHAKALVERLCPESERAFGLEVIHGAASNAAEMLTLLGRVREALATPGFLGGRKVVWLRGANFLHESPSGKGDEIKERVNDLAQLLRRGLPAGQTLIISATKVDKRTAFFKACEAAGALTEFAMPDKGYQAEEQSRERAREAFDAAGVRIAGEAFDAFLEKVGTDTRQIVQEVRKLAVYLGERKEARPEDVEAVGSPSRESAFWDFSDAVGERDAARALKILHRLFAQGEAPVGIIIMLHGHLRMLLTIRECLDRKWLQAYGEARPAWRAGPEADALLGQLPKDPRQMHPFRLQKLAHQAGKFTAAELIRAHELAVRTHEQMVSGGLEPELLLELLVARLQARPAPGPAAPARR